MFGINRGGNREEIEATQVMHPGKQQLPLSVELERKRDMRTQFGALCYRIVKNKTQILLITSRRTKRWVIPKGWPMQGKTPAESAVQEAWEEAGVKGKVTGPCLALYSYEKRVPGMGTLPCAVMVFPVKVSALSDRFPERTQRKRKWMSPKKAAQKIAEPELAHFVRRFDAQRFGL
ncbi:NUDIX hydrolase [Roseovarius aestuariivivens]|uniref:NUDIX hydrolase n=1 Tax=Roseovarius aestuariivivens TaxID=1888910 RepID=UPI001FDA4414|nr:NUDIX hydrolase [Roseovarius aestuariivivens]